MKKAYIFDLDGTLVDSMGYYADGMLAILKEDGIAYPEDIINIITPLGTEKTAELFAEMGIKGTTEEIIARMGKKMVYLYSECIKAKPFVAEYLKRLVNEGKRLFVLTASPHITVDVCLKNNGLYDLFEEIWSTDDFLGLTKSDLKLFFEAAERIGCNMDEVEYFDDNIIALENAAKAGFNTVGVYDEHYEVPKEKVKIISGKYIMSFEEML